MTEDEAYKVHIQYTFNAFCKVVIRHAAIDKILKPVSYTHLDVYKRQSHTRSRTGLASTTRRICGPIRTRICRGIGCRNITLSPKSHPKEAAPAPMKRRMIATQTTQTKEITYD